MKTVFVDSYTESWPSMKFITMMLIAYFKPSHILYIIWLHI